LAPKARFIFLDLRHAQIVPLATSTSSDILWPSFRRVFPTETPNGLLSASEMTMLFSRGKFTRGLMTV
jgi:hypothetical protein